ncbi:gliding motility-associated C-terminal domain-containing protein, partial [Jejuia spongiicola]
STELTINATVDDGTFGITITNTTSSVKADQSDPNIENNIGSVSIIPTAFIDLSLTKTVVDDVENPEVGDMITFEIQVDNEGPTEATGVQVTDLIPSGYDFVNYSSSIGTYNPDTGLWDIGFIEIGNTAVLLVDVLVMDNGEYVNCAEITAANEIDIDSTPANGEPTEDDFNCASVPPLQAVDLGVVKTVVANNLTPMVDTEVSFEIRLTNHGPIDATEVLITDLLPNGYSFLNYSSTKGTYDYTTGIWNVGSIINGETEILIIDAIVNESGNYLNCVTITSLHQEDTGIENNTSCIATEPVAVVDIELTKDVDELMPVAESNVVFTIELTNSGPSVATGVEVMDLLPSGYNFVNATTTSGVYNDTTGVWIVGSIGINASETLTIVAYVLPIGEWENIAEVISANEFDLDSTPNNNDPYEDDQASVTPEPIVLLTIPEGFTPNGDDTNDVFEIEHLEVLYPNFSMEIVNRNGNTVYKYQHNGDPLKTPIWWDGYSTGKRNFSNGIVPAGTYFYVINFNNNERKPQTGWVYLRR